MDKFLTKNKVKDRSKHAVNVSAKDRARSMPQVLHEDDSILFCSICNVSIDHTCKSTINHLKSKSHLKRKHEMDSEQSSVKVLKQTTAAKKSLASGSVAKQSHVEVITDWIKACTAADIPLEKSDSPALREFFHKHVKNGGAIPQSSQLRESYFSDVYENERTLVKQKTGHHC
uniref:U1-type domain-containing protein n=1 Tax=Latimeria chalumnae TaxID=7897 RepID=H2ZYZ8_LATCH